MKSSVSINHLRRLTPNSLLKVGVGANDGGRLASELKNDRLQVLSTGLSDDTSNSSRSSEAVRRSGELTSREPRLRPNSLDLPDSGVSDDGFDNSRSIVGSNVDDVEDTSRKTSSGKDVGEDELGLRREFTRLQDGRVTSHDRLSACTLRQDDWRVPGGPACSQAHGQQQPRFGERADATCRKRHRRGSAVECVG